MSDSKATTAEPVAWRYQFDKYVAHVSPWPGRPDNREGWEPLYAHPPAAPEVEGLERFGYYDGAATMVPSDHGPYVRYDQAAARIAGKDAEIATLRRAVLWERTLREDDHALRNKAESALQSERAARMAAEQALREIVEEWAGAECGEPVYAQEAYAISLAKRMYALAAAALAQEQRSDGK